MKSISVNERIAFPPTPVLFSYLVIKQNEHPKAFFPICQLCGATARPSLFVAVNKLWRLVWLNHHACLFDAGQVGRVFGTALKLREPIIKLKRSLWFDLNVQQPLNFVEQCQVVRNVQLFPVYGFGTGQFIDLRAT